MEELILMRHAEAHPPGVQQPDSERELTATGVAQACRAGEWLRAQACRPQLLLHSPARRALQTAEQLQPFWPDLSQHSEAGVYAATTGELLAIVQAHVAVGTLLLVGHNPAVAGLLRLLLESGPERNQPVPPATVARIGLAHGLMPGRGQLRQMWRP